MKLTLNKQQAAAELNITHEFYDELLHDFLNSATTGLDELAAAVSARDLDPIFRVAHRLKGSAAAVKLEPIRKIALALEIAGHPDRNWTAVRERIDDLKAAVEELKTLLA
ncbi:MAG: Hpt domain-containing protein [Planctomycetota bacterium]